MLALAYLRNPFNFSPAMPLLSFSTLGCPKWTFPDAVKFAAANSYTGLEMRGILGQLDLTKCPEFDSPEHIAATKKLMDDHKLRFVDLGSSCELHHSEDAERKKHLDEGRRFIDLAKALDCPYIRVFPNKLPDDQTRQSVIDLIISGLSELGKYAEGTGVSVLMESHGDAVRTAELRRIMETVNRDNVGMVWDIVNMWSVTKQPPSEVYAQLKPFIKHTHIKDANIIDGVDHYVLLGRGQTPIFEAIDILAKDGYKGYYSFEWEKLWHPEIAEPEIALADYPKTMISHFEKVLR